MNQKGLCCKNFVISFPRYCWKIYKVRRNLIGQSDRRSYKVQKLPQKAAVQLISDQRFSHVGSSQMIQIKINCLGVCMNSLVLNQCKTNIKMRQISIFPLTDKFLGSYHHKIFSSYYKKLFIANKQKQPPKVSYKKRCS